MEDVARHKLNVDVTELAEAMENAPYELIYVLDLETGKVLWTSDEDRREVERIWAEIENAATADFSVFEEALARRDVQDWERDSLLEAARIEEGFGTRYRRIEPEDSQAGYRDMEAFIDTVEDAALHEQLERAIQGRGAFNHFKVVLLDYPER